MPTVLNKKRDGEPPGAVYIGRPSKWGNPFRIGPNGDRAAVIEAYREYLRTRLDLVAAARRELVGRDLLCWCAPLPCHGDVLLEIANDSQEA